MKKQTTQEPLVFEIYREQRNKLRISLAVNAILFVTVILTVIFS